MNRHTVNAEELSGLLAGFARGERRALARLLSLVEAGMAPPPPATAKPCRVVGITGSGGAGKSTLIDALVRHLRGLGLTVAVLASDPQSPKTGGALLGDRVRMRFEPSDEGVYFRSMSTRGAPGGLSAASGEAVKWLRAFGFDVVLVETVGAGQDQVAVRGVVDTLLLVVTPASGDEIQWEKAGLIELADVVAVNKADLPGADRVRQQLAAALGLVPGARPVPVLSVVAATGQGIADLWEAISRLPPGNSPAAAG